MSFKNKINEILIIVLLFLGMNIIAPLSGIYLNEIIKNKNIAFLVANSIYLLLVVFFLRKYLIRDWKIFKTGFKSNIKTGFKYWAIGLLIMYVANIIINLFIMKGQIASNEEINREFLKNFPYYTVFSACVFAPIIEEITFRFAFKPFFKNKILFYLVSGCLFGLAHALTDITTLKELLYIIPYGALGYMFALIYDKTNSIWSSICMHFVHNFITCLLLLSVL